MTSRIPLAPAELPAEPKLAPTASSLQLKEGPNATHTLQMSRRQPRKEAQLAPDHMYWQGQGGVCCRLCAPQCQFPSRASKEARKGEKGEVQVPCSVSVTTRDARPHSSGSLPKPTTTEDSTLPLHPVQG